MPLLRPRRLGLALGSGAARGIAHVGVLKALEAAGIRPAVITGTSMGAVVGSLYATYCSAAKLEEIATAYDIRELLSLADVTLKRGAVLNGERVEAFLREHLPPRFEDLCIPFACVSTDLVRSQRVVHRSGGLVPAVRASLSIPVVFQPVRYEDRLLVDGALVDPVPVGLAREMGAEVVVAVDVTGHGTVDAPEPGEAESSIRKDIKAALRGEGLRRRGVSAVEVAVASIETFEREVARPELAQADIVISPGVHDYRAYEFLSAETLIALGEEAGREAVARIKRKARLA